MGKAAGRSRCTEKVLEGSDSACVTVCKEDPNAGVNQRGFGVLKKSKSKTKSPSSGRAAGQGNRTGRDNERITDKPANRKGKTGLKYTKGQTRGRCRKLGR